MSLPNLPNTARRPQPAAALVLHYLPVRQLEPMFAQLDAHVEQRPVGQIRLVPVQVVDFYAWKKPE
jgi:hypothetical protein